MTTRARSLLAVPTMVLLALLAGPGPGQEDQAAAGEGSADSAPPEETAPPTLETLAARVERLERIVLGAGGGEGVVAPDLELPGTDTTALRLAELERRLQRLELGASTPAGGLAQVESRLRQVESRLSRVETDLRRK